MVQILIRRVLSAAVEMMAGAVVFLPGMALCNKLRFHSWRKTALYSLFGLYLLAMGGLVGLPSIYYVRFGANLNLIPFYGLIRDFKNCLLNVALFVPLGIFLHGLWRKDLNAVAREGFCISLTIEILQLFTLRACDINDLMTNTLGAVLGFLLAGAVVGRSPRPDAPGYDPRDRFLIYGAVLTVMMLVQPPIANFFWSLIRS